MRPAFLLSLVAVACWEQSDIYGTFVASDSGCRDATELFFGPNEVFVKRHCSQGVENSLFRGHWYRSGLSAILEGSPSQRDASVPFEFITRDSIRFGNSLLTRTSQATSIDTLAMVGYGYYAATDPSSNFKRALFTEGRMTMFFTGNTLHGPWNITSYSANQVAGVLLLPIPTPVHITKMSPTSLCINGIDFDLEKH
ncbi:hypothetical protein DSO57_1033092 [Entomophthora muscae]|uniref:Uncharacterized protein n=1 Tax=Entomophthora muscae TaxID=34485 RepID=A0ACC2S2A7_9FUNG|nr:hypothetical protein DSO57_1033092 [Entomophthora muscae]